MAQRLFCYLKDMLFWEWIAELPNAFTLRLLHIWCTDLKTEREKFSGGNRVKLSPLLQTILLNLDCVGNFACVEKHRKVIHIGSLTDPAGVSGHLGMCQEMTLIISASVCWLLQVAPLPFPSLLLYYFIHPNLGTESALWSVNYLKLIRGLVSLFPPRDTFMLTLWWNVTSTELMWCYQLI